MWWSQSETLSQIIIKTTTITERKRRQIIIVLDAIRPDISQLACDTPDSWLVGSRGGLCVTTTSQLLV